MDLKVGDVVRLKTGGPKMTVQRLDVKGYGTNTEMIEAVWFEQSKLEHLEVQYGDFHCADFAPAVLEKLVEASPAQAEAA